MYAFGCVCVMPTLEYHKIIPKPYFSTVDPKNDPTLPCGSDHVVQPPVNSDMRATTYIPDSAATETRIETGKKIVCVCLCESNGSQVLREWD